MGDVALPLAGVEVPMLGLVGLGLLVGFLAGFFGVGGGFLMTPLLNIIFNVPYNVAVGSDLSQMVGTSSSATIKHRKLGNVDFRLGVLMIVGTMLGVEVGAQFVEVLKKMGNMSINNHEIEVITVVVSAIYAILLGLIGLLVAKESRRALKAIKNKTPAGGGPRFAAAIRRINLPPMISLPKSGIEKISLWVILGVGFVTGILAGLLGVGGGFIRMPALIYIIGAPTSVAIGTDLFEIVFSSSYGAFTHSLKQNVDLILVVVLLLGSTIGAQVGSLTTSKFKGPKIRYLFSWIAFIAIIFVAIKFLVKVGYIGG